MKRDCNLGNVPRSRLASLVVLRSRRMAVVSLLWPNLAAIVDLRRLSLSAAKERSASVFVNLSVREASIEYMRLMHDKTQVGS